jgi:hypothetical protein
MSLSTTPPPPEPHGPDPAQETRHHFFLILATAWLPLWFWIHEVMEFHGALGGALLIPLAVCGGLAAVWWLFTARAWKAPTGPRDPNTNVAIIVTSIVGVAGWFVMPAFAVLVVPPIGIGHSFGMPNPIGLLAAPIFAGAVSWFSAERVRRLLGHGPTAGLVTASLAAGLLPCIAVLSVRAADQSERERLMIRVGDCRQDSYIVDDAGKTIDFDKCFDTAERVRAGVDGPVDFARVVDLYKYGCMQFESSSCTALGELYERGEGVPKSRAKAGESYAKGCANSSPTAQAACDHLKRLRSQ